MTAQALHPRAKRKKHSTFSRGHTVLNTPTVIAPLSPRRTQATTTNRPSCSLGRAFYKKKRRKKEKEKKRKYYSSTVRVVVPICGAEDVVRSHTNKYQIYLFN